MGEFIEEKEFNEFAMPCMVKICTEMRKRHPTIPLLNFPRDAMYGLSACQEAGYDVVTLDLSADRKTVREALKKEAEARGTCVPFFIFFPLMRIRNSHGLASQADLRESDSDSQAFLTLCESPCRRCFLRGVGTAHR